MAFLDINLASSIFKALDYHSLTKDLPVYGKTKLEIVRLCMRNDPQFKEKLDLYHYFLLEDGKLAVTSELPGISYTVYERNPTLSVKTQAFI